GNSPRQPPAAPQKILTARPAPRVRFALRDGERSVFLDERGRLHGLEALPPDLQRGVGEALRNGSVNRPRLLARRPDAPAMSFMSGGGGALEEPSGRSPRPVETERPFALYRPLNTMVASLRPTFRWQAVPEATGYTLSIMERDTLAEVATWE